MDITINILLLLLMITALFLCVFLIIFLKKLFKQVEAVRNDVHLLVESTIPILNHLEEVSLRANRMVTEVGDYWQEIDNSIRNVRKIITMIGSWKIVCGVTAQTSKFIRKFRSITSGPKY